MKNRPQVLEICAGAGGTALGLEMAGFEHVALVEIDSKACATLRCNRPQWNVIQRDLRELSGDEFHGIDVIAGGLPSPPFSVAGEQHGIGDPRDLFPAALQIVRAARPRVVFIDNVKGLLAARFDAYRVQLLTQFERLGYETQFKLINASDFGVAQSRPIAVLVSSLSLKGFSWPDPAKLARTTVGHVLHSFMAARGWEQADQWSLRADAIAPTIVGGSKEHGGPDLGPSRTKKAWEQLGVIGLSLANEAPEATFVGMPRLTLPMVAALQGFPEGWRFEGAKTAVYRQIAQALPPPVAHAIGASIRDLL